MLRQHIYNKLEKESIGQRQLANVANVNESTISRYLNGYDELKFESILKIVKFLFPDQEKEYIAEYALTQKSQNARHCMEYCMINRLWDVTEQLIERLSSSTNPADREWAKVYELELIRAKKQMDLDQLLEEMKKFYPNALEVQIMHTFVVAYIYFDMNKHNLLFEYLENVEKQIIQIKSQFIHDCYGIRLGLLMNSLYLYQNNIEKTRKYCLMVIEQDVAVHVKANALHNLGSSYLYEDYFKAKEYLEQSIQFYRNTNREPQAQIVLRTLSFLESYWNIDHDFSIEIESDTDKHNYAFYLIQKKEINKAKEILKHIDSNSLPDWNKGFYYYYKGLIDRDKTMFYHSVKWFRNTENLFHLQLPIQELQQLDEEEVLLEIFSK